jgi:uridine phosphorylase
VEMEAAALFALGASLGIEVGCILAVAAGPGGEPRISDEVLREVELAMGRAAAAAYEAADSSSTSSRD